jgi:hypothetical protein
MRDVRKNKNRQHQAFTRIGNGLSTDLAAVPALLKGLANFPVFPAD